MFADLMSRWTMPARGRRPGRLRSVCPSRATRGRQGLAGDLLPQRLAFQQLHGDEGLPVGFVDFVNGADVRMIERGRGLGFALKTAQGLRVLGDVLGQKFQRDRASELEVFRFVDHPHAARCPRPKHAVVRNSLAG